MKTTAGTARVQSEPEPEPNDLCVLVRPSVAGTPLGTDPAAGPGSAAADDSSKEPPCFNHVDRAMIRAYFRDGDAPPSPRVDDESQDVRRAPSVAKVKFLPHDLEVKLSPLPAGYARMIAGSDVMLVDIESQTVVDLVRDIDDTSLV